MALRKPRFIHKLDKYVDIKKCSWRGPRGYTVYLQPISLATDWCNLSVTYCSMDDHFCYRVGREQAMKAAPKPVRVVDLPEELVRIHAVYQGFPYNEDAVIGQYAKTQFSWVWKYFL